MTEYKDAFEAEKTTMKLLPPDSDGYMGFCITRNGHATIYIPDASTFREIVRELNTLTWSVRG